MRTKGFCKLHPTEQTVANGECRQCAQDNLAAKRPRHEAAQRRFERGLRRRGLDKTHKTRCGVRK